MKKALSRFLIDRPRALSTPCDSKQVDIQVLDAEILALAERARACIGSPLVRKANAYPRFAIGASTFSKKVAAGQMPPPAYKSRSITAYKEIDLDMMLAAQALATRNGFILNATAFVAALCTPVDATAEVVA